MSIKQQSINLILGLAIGAGGVAFLGSSHATAVAKDEKKEEKITNADYARSARAYLRKAHEDVDHCVNSASDKKEKGYEDAEEAKRAIDRADHALVRYLEAAEAAPAKK